MKYTMMTVRDAFRMICLVGVCCWAASPAMATPITAEQAKRAVAKWIRERPAAHMGGTFGSEVSGVRSVEGLTGTNIFYIADLDAGGFVVTSADDEVMPVIAFSDTGTLTQDDRNPLWALLKVDMAQRMRMSKVSPTNAIPLAASVGGMSPKDEWDDLLSEDDPTKTSPLAVAGRSSLSDVRVAALMASKWGQTTAYNDKCYNRSTPNNYPCGCVATAGAQLMYFHKYPKDSQSATNRTFSCWVSGSSVSKKPGGGWGDWNTKYMPADPATDYQTMNALDVLVSRIVIGALCYDVGVVSRMNWGKSESGACLCVLIDSLENVYDYASARCIMASSMSTANLKNTIYANLDAGYPVLLGIKDTSAGGHCVVADGYGYYSSRYYTHLNMGWEGDENLWYALPSVPAGNYDFSVLTSVGYNIFPSATGELVTGRVTDEDGNPLSGVSVTATYNSTTKSAKTNSKGIYAIQVTGGRTYSISVEKDGYESAKTSVSVSSSCSSSYSNVTADGCTFSPDGVVGNVWGNDFTLSEGSGGDELVSPENVTATKTSTASVTISWDAVSGVDGYYILRAIDLNDQSTMEIFETTSTSYVDTTAVPGISYYYVVVSYIGDDMSDVTSYVTGLRLVSLSLGASSQNVEAGGGAKSVSVTANTSWSATTTSSWLSFTTSSGSGSGSLAYSASANTSTSSRTGTITVTAGGVTVNPKTVTLTVTQAGRVEPTVSVTAATVKPRWPWNGVVDIDYTIVLSDAPGAVVSVSGYDGDRQRTLAATSLSGATNVTASGTHRITWNVGADYPGLNTTALKVNVTATAQQQVVTTGLYLVIDLSAGADAASYPVTSLSDVPSGGWTDEYKTTKLVLRRIEPGTFTMGSPSGEVGRYDDYEAQHQVTLTKAFYMGVFEVTQRQWELVMGTKPSYFSNASYYASRPVEQVSYNDIRGSSAGTGWPASPAVDATSFLGKLRAKTGLNDFDLPTEAQWEYACRAGTTTALNSGKNLTSTSSDANMAEVGRYGYNSGYYPNCSYSTSSDTTQGTAKVGSYAPNDWGLYDMHGNVWEWCLDWWTGSLSAATDPVGAASNSYRSGRGGSWDDRAQTCRSACRGCYANASRRSDRLGFRLSRTLAQ